MKKASIWDKPASIMKEGVYDTSLLLFWKKRVWHKPASIWKEGVYDMLASILKDEYMT